MRGLNHGYDRPRARDAFEPGLLAGFQLGHVAARAGERVAAHELERDVKLVTGCPQALDHSRVRVFHHRRLRRLVEDLLQGLVEPGVHHVLHQDRRVRHIGRDVTVMSDPSSARFPVEAHAGSDNLVDALPHPVELLGPGHRRPRVHQGNTGELGQAAGLHLLLLLAEERPTSFPLVLVIGILSGWLELLFLAKQPLLLVLLLDLRVLLLAFLGFPSLLRGDRGGVHDRRARRVKLPGLDEVQTERASLQQRQPRFHHVNLLLPRQRNHEREQTRGAQRSLSRDPRPAARLRRRERDARSAAAADGADHSILHQLAKRLETKVPSHRVSHKITQAPVQMREVGVERLRVVLRPRQRVWAVEELLQHPDLLAHVVEPHRRGVHHANEIRKRTLA